MRINKNYDHQRKNALIFYQILWTNTLRKCMRISLESLYIDTMLGFEGLNTYSKYSDYITLAVLLSSSNATIHQSLIMIHTEKEINIFFSWTFN